MLNEIQLFYLKINSLHNNKYQTNNNFNKVDQYHDISSGLSSHFQRTIKKKRKRFNRKIVECLILVHVSTYNIIYE